MLIVGIAYPGSPDLDDSLVSEIGARFDAGEVRDALLPHMPQRVAGPRQFSSLRASLDPLEQPTTEVGGSSNRHDLFPIMDPAGEDILMVDTGRDPFGGVNFRRQAIAARDRARGVSYAERVIANRKRADADRARGRAIQAELDWLSGNPLFRGQPPAPGEDFGSYQDRVAQGWVSGERRGTRRRIDRYERSGPYAQDLSTEGFTADQFDFDVEEGDV